MLDLDVYGVRLGDRRWIPHGERAHGAHTGLAPTIQTGRPHYLVSQSSGGTRLGPACADLGRCSTHWDHPGRPTIPDQ